MFQHISMPDILADMQATLRLVCSTYCMRSPRAIRLHVASGIPGTAVPPIMCPCFPCPPLTLKGPNKLCFFISCLISSFWRNPNYRILFIQLANCLDKLTAISIFYCGYKIFNIIGPFPFSISHNC